MAAFRVFLQSGKKRKVGLVGDDSHVDFSKKKHLDGKGKCETVRCRHATASSLFVKVRGEIFAYFDAAVV
jgi:hypothetical protein